MSDSEGEIDLEPAGSQRKEKVWKRVANKAKKRKGKEKYASVLSDSPAHEDDVAEKEVRSPSRTTRDSTSQALSLQDNAELTLSTDRSSQKHSRSFSDPNGRRAAGGQDLRQRGPYSLKTLSATAVCRSLGHYKSRTQLPSFELLHQLLRAMLDYGWLNDSNLPFFLSETVTQLDLSMKDPLGGLSEVALSLIPLCCPALESLSLAGWSHLSHEAWKVFCTTSRSFLSDVLRELSINRVPIQRSTLRLIGSSFSQLEQLSFNECETFKDVEMVQLLAQHVGPTLRGLSLQEINLPSACVEAISAGFPHLKQLDLSVSHWNPHDAYATPEALGTLSQLVKLKELVLSGLDFDNETIHLICQACKRLRKLVLTWPDPRSEYNWSVKITEEILPHIAPLDRMKELGLGDCHRIRNSQLLTAMFTNLTRLEKLNLTSVPAVGDNVIASIAEHCHRMKRLKLQDCVVNPSSLMSLGKSCSKLEYLDVRGKAIQTDRAWQAIAEGCPRLQTLLGNHISPDARLLLHYHCPRLKYKVKSARPTTFESYLEHIFEDEREAHTTSHRGTRRGSQN